MGINKVEAQLQENIFELRTSVAVIVRLLATVTCDCETCASIITTAKQLLERDRRLPAACKMVMETAIAAANAKVYADRMRELHRKHFLHELQKDDD